MPKTRVFIILFISFVLVLAFKSSGEFPKSMYPGNFLPYLADKPLTEDGFYMMTIAWNIADGKGIKYNFDRPTTGIQPLVTFIQAGIAKAVIIFGGDKITFLRIMVLFSSLLLFPFSLAAGSIIKKLVPELYSYTLTLFLVLFSFDLFNYFTNGLETGFYLIMISVCVGYSFHFISSPGYKPALIMGLLAGITALTRVDFLLPLSAYLLILFFIKKVSPVKLLLVIAAAVTLLIPWLGYVYGISGSIFPSSVSTQTLWVDRLSLAERLGNILKAFLLHITPFLHTHNILVSIAAVIINVIVLRYLIKKLKFFNDVDKSVLNNLLFWGTSFLLLSLTYFAYSSALHFYIRYTTPFYLFIFIITASCVMFMLKKLPAKYGRVILASLILLFFVQSYYYIFNGKLSNHLTLRISYIKNHFDKDERIGLFQSGVTGFFLNNAINLDGKVDHVVREYAMNKRFEDFLDSMKINTIIEWRKDFNVNVNEDYFKKNWKLADEDIGDETTGCFVRINQGAR